VDFSKLPKLSETKPDAPAVEPPAPPRPVDYGKEPPRDLLKGGEIWISILIGIVFIYLGARPLEYLFTRSHPEKFTWTFDDGNGNALNYPQTIFFLPDLGVCALGIVLIFDGLQMLLARSVKFAIGALILTAAVTLLNVVALAVEFQNGSGFQLLTFLSIILGGYTAIYQTNAVRQLRYYSKMKMNV
jgi:hypothetical protein